MEASLGISREFSGKCYGSQRRHNLKEPPKAGKNSQMLFLFSQCPMLCEENICIFCPQQNASTTRPSLTQSGTGCCLRFVGVQGSRWGPGTECGHTSRSVGECVPPAGVGECGGGMWRLGGCIPPRQFPLNLLIFVLWGNTPGCRNLRI